MGVKSFNKPEDCRI